MLHLGTVRRRCIRDHLWEEFFGCFREKTKMLLDQVIIVLTDEDSQLSGIIFRL